MEIMKTEELKGTISISGSKNTTLAILPICLLTDDKLTIENIPKIKDATKMLDILKNIGVDVKYSDDFNKIYLQKKHIIPDLRIKEVQEIRASYYIMGAFVANNYSFKTLYPGGCSFTNRPIDYHLEAFKSVGYKINEKDKDIHFIKKRKCLKNISFTMYQKSVGATINIIYISVLRMSKTVINNASLEPEVLEVIKLLIKMGADIKVIDNETIEINGVKKLSGTTFKIVSDRIEAGSYMLLASAVNKSDITLNNIYIPHLKDVIETIKLLGVNIEISENSINIIKDKPIKGIEKTTGSYPYFPTDLQQILCVVLTQANTNSIIRDLIYPNRITHLKEIEKCNGNCKFKDNYIYIEPSNLYGNILYAHDLRCGFACIILGTIADKKSIIENADVILRGYENIVEKLKNIGLLVNVID